MSSFASSSRRRGLGRRGVASIEFALVAGLFFVTLLATIEVARYYMTVQGLRNFMADALRHGVVGMVGGQCLEGAAVVTATGRGGVVGGLVGATSGGCGGGSPPSCDTATPRPGFCLSRTETLSGLVTVRVSIDVNQRVLMSAFGIPNPRFVDAAAVTFQQ